MLNLSNEARVAKVDLVPGGGPECVRVGSAVHRRHLGLRLQQAMRHLQWFAVFPENGSSQGQNMALNCLLLFFLLDSVCPQSLSLDAR